jgi:hypothetical protein
MKKVIFILLLTILSLSCITGCEDVKLEVVMLSVTPKEVNSGEVFIVEATIKNTGGSDGSFKADLTVNGEIIETRNVAVKAKSTNNAEFVIVLHDIGVHEIAIGDVACSVEIKADDQAIVTQVLDASQEIKSCTFNMTMNINASIWCVDASKEMRMKLDGVFDVDNVMKKMKVVINITMDELGASLEKTTMELYILGNKQYTNIYQPGATSDWQVEELSLSDWENMQFWEHHVNLLQKSEIILSGTERVNGIDCYAMQLSPDTAEFLNMILVEQRLGQQFSEEELDILTKALSSYFLSFMDFSAKEWIDRATYLPRKTEMSMDIYIGPDEFIELGLIVLAGYEFSTETNINLTVLSYNEPLSIALPSGARQAKPTK